MASSSRAARAKQEVDDIDLSFLDEDEDILAVQRKSSRKGIAPATQRSPRTSQRSAARSTSTAASSSARAGTDMVRRGKPRGGPSGSRNNQVSTSSRRSSRRDPSVGEDEQDDAMKEDEESDEDVNIDDIIASMNGGGSRGSSSRAKQSSTKKTTSASSRSNTRANASSSPTRTSARRSASPSKGRAPPRQRFAPLHDSDADTDDQDDADSDQNSDDLQQELDDLNDDSDDDGATPRRSTRRSQTKASARGPRSSGRAAGSSSRAARTRRTLRLDDDDDDDDEDDDDDDNISEDDDAPADEEEPESESEDEEDELESSDGEYGRTTKRKSKSKCKPATKRQRLTKGTSKPRARAKPHRKPVVKRNRFARIREPKMRFALQGELPEPHTEAPTSTDVPVISIDESTLPSNLDTIPFIDAIDPSYSPSEHYSEEDKAVSDEEVQVISDAEAGDESDDIDPYKEPDASIDKHWRTCKRCTDGPTLPLYNKALKSLKSAQKKEANKQRNESPERIDSRGRARKKLIDDNWGAVTPVQAAEEWLEVLEDRGGWFECKTCSVSWHWGCLPQDSQKAILGGINREATRRHRSVFGENAPAPSPVRWIDVDDVVDTDSCPDCVGYASYCTVCKANVQGLRTIEEQLGFTKEVLEQCPDPPAELTASKLFRCKRCSRATHYECLARAQTESDQSIEQVAESIQEAGWLCSDCQRCPAVDKIIAWRQVDRRLWNDEEAKRAEYATLSPRENLPREYLVKFKDRSFRETEWVAHDWLRIVHQPLLYHFLAKGSRLELEPVELIESASAISSARKNRASLALGGGGRAPPSTPIQTRSVKKTLKVDETGEVDIGPPGPVPDAQRRIPKPWKTPDRILAVKYYFSIKKDDIDVEEIGGAIIDSDSIPLEKLAPSDYLRSWTHVAKLLIKWQDQPYEGSTWEDPPTRRKQSDIFYETQEAYRSFLMAQKVTFPALTAAERRSKRERRLAKSGTRFRALDDQPHCIEGGDLIDFQLEGVNWLRYGWYNEKPGILADEMGLGKTVQIITFLASIWKEGKAGPFLVVVPNATLPNWLREFEKWMPQFRVVPYWGEGEARDMIAKYEFFHSKKTLDKMDASIRPIKFHVVVASDATVRIDSLPLRKVEHWDVIIVDEGQNLKSGKSILMKRLNEMQAEHRVIMTGTPLNNNVTELFNLLNWLEHGGQWKDVKALEAQYSELKPEVIEDLQKRLKPYFLRRLKKEVLDLPPKIELIVPTSLRPIQKRIYRSILESNIEDIQALAASRETSAKKGKKSTIANLNNTLMQLRKCIQHPYLIAPDLETREGEANYEATWEHQRLIDASAKLSLLQRLLPKLKAAGHRILLFSQFVINLDIVEVFLRGEGYKYLRLDGAIGQKQRQKGIDAFNAPDSPYFIYMISTRAGGVGINLATADTVIIFDPDWNPHVDTQAIARAHRIGQTKKLLVFTLMCKATAEERIIQVAKRKMMLDHLIVHNLDREDERPVELESILKFGAQALFAEGGTEESERDIRYTDEDLDSLLRRREDAVEDEDKDTDQGADGEPKGTFSYARVWEADQAAAGAAGVAPATVVDDDFWADLLDKHREDAARRAEEAREREAEEKRASRRDRIKAMLQDDEANEAAAAAAAAPVKRGRGRPKKVPKPVVDEDFTVVDGDSDSDDHELIGAVQEEDEALPAVQALRQRQIKSSNAAIAAAAAAAAAAAVAAAKAGVAGSASTASTVPSDKTALYSAPSAAASGSSAPVPSPAVVAKKLARAAAKPLSSAASVPSAASKKKSKPSPAHSLAQLQRDLIAEHRLPSPAPLGDIDLSLPVTTIQPGHLAAMRRVLLSLLPDSDFAAEVASRSLSNTLPDLVPPHSRFQLTSTHINYYAGSFLVPRELFEAAFSIVSEDSIPAEILALPYGGAMALDWRKIKEILLRAAVYMVHALRRLKTQAPWEAAIAEWNKANPGKPPSEAIDVDDDVPVRAVAPTPWTAAAAVEVLRDRTLCESWLAAVRARGDEELTKVAQLVTSNPTSTPSPNLVLMVQSFMDGKGAKPVYGPSKLSIRAWMRAEVFVDPDVMGPPTTTSAAAGNVGNGAGAAAAGASPTPSGSQIRPNRVAAALSRLSAFSGGSPMRDNSKKELSRLNVDVAVSYRKPRIKSSRSSIGGSPRSSLGPSPSPSLQGDSVSSVGGLDSDSVVDDGSTFVISDQTCIICGGAFHYLNRCPEMQDLTRASARWFQLCEQLRILTARGMTDGDSDVATIKTTIKVMARKLNGLRVQNGQGPLVPPFA